MENSNFLASQEYHATAETRPKACIPAQTDKYSEGVVGLRRTAFLQCTNRLIFEGYERLDILLRGTHLLSIPDSFFFFYCGTGNEKLWSIWKSCPEGEGWRGRGWTLLRKTQDGTKPRVSP